MSLERNNTRETDNPELQQALRNFRASVHAWSEAEFSRPRTLAPSRHHASWRIAASWALGCVLAAASLAGGFFAHHYREQAVRPTAPAAAVQPGQQQTATAAVPAPQPQKSDDALLADVDKDISRAVPSAMEPLAQLMDESSSQEQ
jgi:hypothetical protein